MASLCRRRELRRQSELNCPNQDRNSGVSKIFEELDYGPTEAGTLSLRRRKNPATDQDIYEIKLNDDFLMSSQFTDSEVALARIGLAETTGSELDIVVGGLGLGYTAWAALQNAAVGSLTIVEIFAEVIHWHNEGLVPLGPELANDSRCDMVRGDFFDLSDGAGFDPSRPGRKFDAVLLDIDHSPRYVLHAANVAFYSAEGLAGLSSHLKPGGTFALWSNDPPDEEFLNVLRGVATKVKAHPIKFSDRSGDGTALNTVYIAHMGKSAS